MAKTGKKAAFSLNEKKTAMVNLPAQFVTASDANKKGQSYSSLVDYAKNESKTSDQNNESIAEMMALKDQFQDVGYANRTTAVTENNPIFGPDKLNYDNHDISVLRKQLDEAQANGNNIHELAFSIRGDWLVENNLYDPDTGMIDQNRLKHAEQKVSKILINDGFKSPLGESPDDVVWFGVIHQDTDHLNMHLWFAKRSKETRHDMLKQEGPYKGQPTGVVPLSVIERSKREFRNELMADRQRDKRTDVLKGIGHLHKELAGYADENLVQDKYASQIEAIYDALPPSQKGRWRVGNTTLAAANNQMSKANSLTNNLLDQVFEDELQDEYTEFKQLTKQFDDINVEDKGVLRKGQQSFSEKKDADLRKRLANGLYRQLNDVNYGDIKPIEQMLNNVKENYEDSKSDTGDSAGASLKEKKLDPIRIINDSNGLYGQDEPTLPRHDSSDRTFNESNDLFGQNKKKQPSYDKSDRTNNENNGLNGRNKGISPHLPSYNKSDRTIKKISRVFQNEIRSEVNIERQFLRNQKKVEQEKAQEQYESQISRGL